VLTKSAWLLLTKPTSYCLRNGITLKLVELQWHIMVFNSVNFLIFFPTAVIIYFLIPMRWRWLILLIASYYFYAGWKLEYLILILYSTLIDFFVGLKIAKTDNLDRRKRLLGISLMSNLGLLFIFKYFNFFGQTFQIVFNILRIPIDIPTTNLILPVGISFYTFQTLSYTFEVYRGHIKPEKNLGVFALFVSFFPQLVAGPIERPQHLLPQFRQKFTADTELITSGLRLMLWGMFKKVVIADQLARLVNIVYNDPDNWRGLIVIVATYCFAIQIYCDFSGYTDIAIGAARVMGFDLGINFREPYFAQSIAGFWRRWHISLSTWFRDYLYIPLGGNRISVKRTYLNLMIVFIISGLWHGANWTFVVWGAIHGFYMVLGLWTQDMRNSLSRRFHIVQYPRLLLRINVFLTFHLVVFAWIFFRANTMPDAFTIIRNMFYLTPAELIVTGFIFTFLFLLAGIKPLHEHRPISSYLQSKSPQFRWAFYTILVLMIINLGVPDEVPFIYFQF
jgi:alginate O-acetyltransferase complex protein AlgI